MSEDPTHSSLATVTHARLRAAQGDQGGARRILKTVLLRRPGDPEARALLEILPSRREREAKAETEEAPAPPETSDPGTLAGALRQAPVERPAEVDREATVRRLRRILERIQAGGESSDAG